MVSFMDRKELKALRLRIFLATLLVAWGCLAENPMRTWSSRSGVQIQAAFLKEERDVWFLKRADETVVQVKPEALSDEDQAYVFELTYEPKVLEVLFQRAPGSAMFREKGTPTELCFLDTVILRLDMAVDRQAPRMRNNSTWNIESLDHLGQLLRAREEGLEALRTEGSFVFLMYKVTNDGTAPMKVMAPHLVDTQERVFTQAQPTVAHHYVPSGVLMAEHDELQPGLSKLFCAFYELPPKTEVQGIQVFPSLPHRALEGVAFRCEGKRINAKLSPKPSAESLTPRALRGMVFMSCVRVGRSGATSGITATSTVSYAVDIRLLDEIARTIVVKGYFMGDGSKGARDVILSKKEEQLNLNPGRLERIVLTSDESIAVAPRVSQAARRHGRAASSLLETIDSTKVRGVIIQAWIGEQIVSSWASLPQHRKYADNPRLEQELNSEK